ncbi:Stem cell self-renewal protein Piwi [Lasallia pustulata]|uniref:Stem cell self-renewal protein Piwi n=1 Tax=Lasallia pustulata TaxID=136370 RepID=A0A1W5DCD2_9LECA|nr:Stem cell self-renewal protein Piwi [Lasallia pustulata]
MGPNFVFDGVSLGWSPDKLMEVGESKATTLDLSGHLLERPNQVDVTIRHSGTLHIRKLVDYIKAGATDSTTTTDPAVEDCFKALNALYRQDPASRMITRPKSTAFFERAQGLMMPLQSTGGILEALRGIHQAIHFFSGKLTINVDVVVSAYYTPDLSAVDVAKAFAGIPPHQDVVQWASSHPTPFRQACERMTGMFFCVRHLNAGQNERKMRVMRVSLLGARETEFEEQDRGSGRATLTNVYNYFMRKYRVSLKFPNLPLLICKEGHFPMELCFTASGERYKEALQGQETADFIRFATAPAYVRAQQIVENVKKLHWHELNVPKAFGLSVSSRMLEIEARLLPTPVVKYGRGTETRGPESGFWNLRGKQLLMPSSFVSYGVSYLPAGRGVNDQVLQGLTRNLVTSLAGLGLGAPIGQPPAFILGNPQGDLNEMIQALFAKTGNLFKRKPELFIFLVHQDCTAAIYKVLKNLCERQFGVASQVMVVEKALKEKGQMQYLGNVGLKINLKLGGRNSCVEEPLFHGKRWMMIGADVSHPSAGQLRQNPPPPSFTALTASYDPECVVYTAVTSAQPATVELIADIRPMFKELLVRFSQKNRGNFPEAIIYWRDSVGGSSVPGLMEQEVKPLKEVCEELELSIRITVCTTIKRHHTRAFPVSEKGDKLGNCLPGTCFEASANPKDFFLISQSALQGTCRPCHYTTIQDENNFSTDEFQRIAYTLCFAYGRATRSVGLVPPVYYAHQACERARISLRTVSDETFLPEPHEDLKFTMYWQ